MKKFLQFERSPARQLRGGRQWLEEWCCDSGSPCLRCSMIALASYRFAIFNKKFGRLPGPDDELFFDDAWPHPVRACDDEIKSQIFAAAEACGLNFFILLSYLGLSSRAVYDERTL
jgi:hypothetical protein